VVWRAGQRRRLPGQRSVGTERRWALRVERLFAAGELVTQADSQDLQERIRAMSLTFGAAYERVLRDMLALLTSVTHKDLAAFIAELEAERQGRRELLDVVSALASQQGEIMVAVHRLQDELRALAAGIAAQPLADPYDHHE